MTLGERLRSSGASTDYFKKDTETPVNKLVFQNAKFQLHKKLIERVDLEALSQMLPDEARRKVKDLVEKLIVEEKVPMNASVRQDLVKEIVNETFGLGPLEPLLAKSSVDEILVNGPHQVYVEQHGKLLLTNIVFKDASHLRHVINRIVAAVGRRIDEACPMVDARLKDGSRVNAIIHPLALDGPILSIRRFKKIPLIHEDLIRLGTMNQKICDYLQFAVENKLNILISGGTGTGKTTILNVLSRFIPSGERIITIEDAAELQLQQPHVVRLETRPANVEGKGRVVQRDLVRNALRMRPDRIILGEVRGEEALDMLQAVNTGHEGSMTTVHANSPQDAIARVETMVLMGNSNLTHIAITRQIASAFHVIIQLKRLSDGRRKISSMLEIVGMEKDLVVVQELVKFEETGTDSRGQVLGEFVFTPVRPKFFTKLQNR